MKSIFKTTGPLDIDQDRAIYVERPELQEMFREIRRPYVESYVALLGARQMGKTTLLYRVYRELKRAAEPVAFLDLSAYRVETVAQSYAHASLKIWAELADVLVTPAKLRTVASTVESPIRFREFLLELARKCQGTRIVVLLDEVGPYMANMGFFETLRSISSSGGHDSEQAFKKLIFVFSGTVDLHELTTGQNSPLANVCKPIYLDSFDLAGTGFLVDNLNQIAPVEADVVPYVHEYANGHPYLTQRICSLIEQSCWERDESPQRISRQDVDLALDRIYEGDENLRYVSMQLERYGRARDLLRQIVMDERVVPFSLIDPRIARLFIMGAIRRQTLVKTVNGVPRERSRCAVPNQIYDYSLRRYFEALPPPEPAVAASPGASAPGAASGPAPEEMWPSELGPAVDPRNYVDFHVRILTRPSPGQPFPLIVDSWAGRGRGHLMLDVQDSNLWSYIRRLEQHLVDHDDLRNLGTTLWMALFGAPQIGRRYVACQAEAGADKGIRLKLDIEPPLLAGLPWEYLYDPEAQTFPALSPRTPITRYTVPGQKEPPPLDLELPLRILIVSAEPAGEVPLDVEAERSQIIKAMAHLQRTGKVEIESLENATVRRLQSMLRRPFHVLHYIGHGVYDERSGSGMLALEDPRGKRHAISAAQLQYLLRDTTVRLGVFNACMTARGAAGRGIAGELMHAGLSATLAMEFAISEDSATIFAGEFYRTLADGWPVDAAVAEGRKAMMFATGLSAMDWGIPILFMRTHDGVLFRRRL
jgi:hypothetical protein